MKEISPYDLKINPFGIFSKRWMLLTAGNQETGCNTMTVSWGELGSLWGFDNIPGEKWGQPVATAFVRPQRYTNSFMEREAYFTLAVYDNTHKKALFYLGENSGRDEDKVAKVGLEPVYIDDTAYISGAELVFVCRKLYQAPILEDHFIDLPIIEENYPERDFHEMYIGRVDKVLVREDVLEKYTK